jgi:7-carboxy-7-deazaguanine synthase
VYSVKEIYFTLQGEGARSGRPAVFCRFAGCNLWSGREADRAGAACNFCDTDFVGTDGPGGGKFSSADQLGRQIQESWPSGQGGRPYVVFTGGEPLLQLDETLVEACHERGFEVAIETNGTLRAPRGVDWVTVSPKPNSDVIQQEGDEFKFVFPQSALDPSDYESLVFDHFYLQPMDGPAHEENTRLAVEFCKQHPQWRLSLQLHKLVGIP